ncbi:MAG: tripartite tricarboxylate transporter substrate-binding protein [Enterocloster clostridioformis]
MEEYLGVPVMVVNKPGGGFAIGYAAALQDSNDGSSISVALSELLGLPYVADVSFDYTDFEPICNFNSTFGALSVNSSAPYDTVEEFVEYCKANPNTVRIEIPESAACGISWRHPLHRKQVSRRGTCSLRWRRACGGSRGRQQCGGSSGKRPGSANICGGAEW